MPRRDVEASFNEATRLHERGIDCYNLGRPAEASKFHHRALAALARLGATGEPSLAARISIKQARIWLSLALSDAELHGIGSGLAALAEAKTIATATADRQLSTLHHGNLGLLHLRAGRLADALSELNQAVGQMRFAEPYDRSVFLVNRGFVHLYQGDLVRASSDLTDAARLAKQAGCSAPQAAALHNLGYLRYLQGDIPLALAEMTAAVDADVDQSLGGIALLDRARVLLDAGLFSEADESLIGAATIFRRDRLLQDLAEAELARAECALLAGDIETTRRLASRARLAFKRRGNDHWRRSAELVLLQGDVAAGRPGARLVPPALRLAEEFRIAGLATKARMATLIAAEALLAAGRLDSARDLAVGVGPVGRNEPISLRLQLRLVTAKLEIASNQATLGRRAIRAGLTELAAYQAKFGSIDMQTASAVHGRRLAELDVSLALTGGHPAEVIAATERGRATSRRLRAVRPPADETTAELLTELRQTVERIRAMESGASPASNLEIERRRSTDLQRQIRERSWTTHRIGETDRPVSLPRIKAALAAEDSEMLVFVSSGDVLHAITVRSDGTAIKTVDRRLRDITERVSRVRADLDMLANDLLPASLRAVVLASMQTSLAWLDDALLRRFHLGERELVVVPTGGLAAVPWGLLPSMRAVPVVVTPSATTWLEASRRVSRAGLVTAIAGPGLALADEEASLIAELWADQGRAILGDQASQQSFAAAMVESSVLHVAAHGRHQTDNPLFSSLRLSDGPLFAYELDQVTRVPEHVILAACELGLATVGPGDEALGLTSVLLHWGSSCVVSGVARVGDDAAASVMIDYHRRLAKGSRSSAALADSLAEFDGPAPVPFVCFGAQYSVTPTSA